MKDFKNSAIVKSLVLLLVVFVVSSCYKVTSTTAVIKVVDENAKAVPGASVHVFPTTSVPEDSLTFQEGLDDTKITDDKGEVFFDYTSYYQGGQSGLFVLDMEISYDLPDTTIVVKSVVKVEEQVDNFKTVEMPFKL